MERNVKFSQPDTRTGKKQPSDNLPEGSGAKNRSKSSTLSLHAVAAAREREEEPPLQRRNSIHNVPFVDVHDPDTRTRMERYKEERRSMLRAKYKAEDYLSSSFSRKKKVSTTSQDSSCEADIASSPVSTPPSPDQDDPSPSPLEKTEDPTETQLTKFAQETNVSQKFLKLKQPEQQQSFISKAFVPEPKNGIFYKTEVAVASVQKKSSNALNFNKPQSRPDELTISASAERENNQKNLARSDSTESSPESESVNVRERASIFGPRKFSETKVRTVSAPVPMARPVPVPRASKQLQSQSMTSPSKIRNMAAMFEQSQ